MTTNNQQRTNDMLRALRTAALGMTAQQAGVDNIANNLANANTTGYKHSTVVFQDLLYQTVQAAGQGEAGGGAQPASLQMGHGATAIATVRNFMQGGFIETGNALYIEPPRGGRRVAQDRPVALPSAPGSFRQTDFLDLAIRA